MAAMRDFPVIHFSDFADAALARACDLPSVAGQR